MTASATATAQHVERLRAAAADGDAKVRDGLVLHVAHLFQTGGVADQPARAVLGDVLLEALLHVERRVRAVAAERLARAPDLPAEVATALANDEIEVAGEVLRLCAGLSDAALIKVAETRSRAHRVMIAQRDGLAPAVCEAITAQRETEVVAALMANLTASPSERAYARCVDVARATPDLCEPMARRPDLPASLAATLYLIAGDALRAAIAKRFDLDEAALAPLVAAASREAAGQHREAPRDADADAEALAAELADRGELTADHLVNAAREERLAFFDHAAAQLANLPVAKIRSAFGADAIRAAAYLCRAIRAPRAVFGAICAGLSRAGRLPAKPDQSVIASAARAFDASTPAAARDSLRALATRA